MGSRATGAAQPALTSHSTLTRYTDKTSAYTSVLGRGGIAKFDAVVNALSTFQSREVVQIKKDKVKAIFITVYLLLGGSTGGGGILN